MRTTWLLGKSVSTIELGEGLRGDSHILPNDTAGTNVEMADFGISHKALGKADSSAGSIKLSPLGLPLSIAESVHHRSLSSSDSIAGLAGLDTPSIDDDCLIIQLAMLELHH